MRAVRCVVMVALSSSPLLSLSAGCESKRSEPAPAASKAASQSPATSQPAATSQSTTPVSEKQKQPAAAQNATGIDAAREVVIDEAADAESRAKAAASLGRSSSAEERALDVELLAGVLTPQTPASVQAAAIASLAVVPEPAAGEALLVAWPSLTPDLRQPALAAFTTSADRASQLLNAIEKRVVFTGDVDLATRGKLTAHADAAVSSKAAMVFEKAKNPDRQKVIDDLSPASKLTGNAERGVAFFHAACMTCHKVGGLGVAMGPDLAAMADRSAENYLVHILDPNRVIEAKFANYVVETKSGEFYAGVVSGEGDTKLLVVAPGGQPKTVARADVKRLRATPLSAMPDGLEIGRSAQDFADLIAFLTTAQSAASEPAKPAGTGIAK